MGILAGVAGLGVLSLGLLEVAKMSSAISAMSNESLESQTQMYVGRALLADQQTCTLNFQDFQVADEKKPFRRAITQKNAAGTGLGTITIFPSALANPIKGFYLSPVAGAPHIRMLEVEFSRNRIFGLDQTFIRSLPLQVRLDGDRITSCTAGDTLKAEDPGPGSDPDDSSVPALAKFGNCDSNPNPEHGYPSGIVMDNTQGGVRQGRDIMCDNLTFPISSSGEISCDEISRGQRAGASLFVSRYGLGCISAGPNRTTSVKAPMMAGLTSREDCKKLPVNPAGSTVTVRSRPIVIGYVDTPLTCINGRWIPN